MSAQLVRCSIYASILTLSLFASNTLPAQPASATQVAPAASPANPDETQLRENVVVLPVFAINEDRASPYQSNQALSTTRVAVPIQDIAQTVSIVTNELLEDTMAPRMLDVAKYVTPVVESSLPYGGDRYQIRGFQVSQEFIDGTNISGADGYSMSLMPYNIERVEIIKGPNAILVPGGSPGGVMNPITKQPLSYNRIQITGELAQYMGNGANVDANWVFDKKREIAARLVAAFWYNDLYAKNQYRHGYMVAPSFSMQLSQNNKLIIKAEIVQNRETNLGGLPLDPSVGNGGRARIVPGLPRDWSFGDDADSRHRATERLSAELHSVLSDHVTSRLYVMADHVRRIDKGGTSAAVRFPATATDPAGTGTTGSRNPYTGQYEPGVLWSVTTTPGQPAVVTSRPIAFPNSQDYIFTRNNTAVDLEYTEAHIKNDYAIRFEPRWFKTTTLLGFTANTSKVHFVANPAAGRPNVLNSNLDAITYPPYIWVAPTPTNNGTDKTAKQNDLQLYIYESLTLLNDHLIFSGGVSRFFGELTRTDSTGTALDPALLTTVPSYNLSSTAYSFGAVIKPIKEISIFYGYNESGGTMPGSLSAGNNRANLKVAEGNQNEYGVKTTLFDGKLTAALSYFEIEQANYPVPNSEFYNLVAQGITPPPDFPNPLYLNLVSRGWEFEGTYQLNKNLTFMGNYTKFKIRQPGTGVRVRAVPDESLGAYVDFHFTTGVLDGFGVNVGADYKSDVVGETTTGVTALGFANQPSFTVAGRTLVNLGLYYRLPNWTVRVNVNNVLDKDYVLAAGSRTSVVMGDPINVKFSITYTFK